MTCTHWGTTRASPVVPLLALTRGEPGASTSLAKWYASTIHAEQGSSRVKQKHLEQNMVSQCQREALLEQRTAHWSYTSRSRCTSPHMGCRRLHERGPLAHSVIHISTGRENEMSSGASSLTAGGGLKCNGGCGKHSQFLPVVTAVWAYVPWSAHCAQI